jgi:hypothetical protein
MFGTNSFAAAFVRVDLGFTFLVAFLDRTDPAPDFFDAIVPRFFAVFAAGCVRGFAFPADTVFFAPRFSSVIVSILSGE